MPQLLLNTRGQGAREDCKGEAVSNPACACVRVFGQWAVRAERQVMLPTIWSPAEPTQPDAPTCMHTCVQLSCSLQ